MLLREITVKQDVEQLDEFIFGGLGLTALALGTVAGVTAVAKSLLIAWAGSEVFDYMLGMTKTWLDSREMKNFKPTGAHIPNHTQAEVDGKRYIYKADSGKWYERKPGRGKKILLVTNVTDGKPKVIPFDSDKFKAALDNNKVKFLDRKATLETMQRVAGGNMKFGRTGNTLEALIAKESMGTGKKVFSGAMNTVRKLVSVKTLQALNFVLPIYAAYNTVALKAVYQDRLRLGKEEGYLDATSKEIYTDKHYDRDINYLRASTTTYIAAYVVSQGGAHLMTGIFWLYYLSPSRNKLEKVVEKSPWFGKMWKLAKTGTRVATNAIGVGIGAGAVLGSVNTDVANGIGRHIAQFLLTWNFNSTGRSLGEVMLSGMFAYFDKDLDKIITQLGGGTVAKTANDKANNKREPKFKQGNTTNNNTNNTTNTNTNTKLPGESGYIAAPDLSGIKF